MIISHRLKRAWERARTNRQLRSYYQSLSGKSGVEKYLLGILLFILGSFYILFNSATLGQSLPQVFLLFLVIVTGWRIMTVRETARLRRLCQERIGEAEFKKRLERTSPAQVLQYLGEKAADSFGAIDLVLQEEKLVGSYQGEKIAIFYQYLEADEVLSTQEMIVMLRWCRQQEIPQARIFVNTDITPKAKGLGERFNLRLHRERILNLSLPRTKKFIPRIPTEFRAVSEAGSSFLVSPCFLALRCRYCRQ